jgi:hypothetical protein
MRFAQARRNEILEEWEAMRIATYILFLSLLVICSCSTHQAYLKASKNYIDTYHGDPPIFFGKATQPSMDKQFYMASIVVMSRAGRTFKD